MQLWYGVEHADFIIVLQCSSTKCAIAKAKADHAERVQLGGSQRSHARGATNDRPAFQSKQNFLVPHGWHVTEVAVDDANQLITSLDCAKNRPECRGCENMRSIWNLFQPCRSDEYANFQQPTPPSNQAAVKPGCCQNPCCALCPLGIISRPPWSSQIFRSVPRRWRPHGGRAALQTQQRKNRPKRG